MKVSKGLEFPVVALPGVGHMPAPGARTRRKRRGCFMWRRQGLRRGWLWGWVGMEYLARVFVFTRSTLKFQITNQLRRRVNEHSANSRVY